MPGRRASALIGRWASRVTRRLPYLARPAGLSGRLRRCVWLAGRERLADRANRVSLRAAAELRRNTNAGLGPREGRPRVCRNPTEPEVSSPIGAAPESSPRSWMRKSRRSAQADDLSRCWRDEQVSSPCCGAVHCSCGGARLGLVGAAPLCRLMRWWPSCWPRGRPAFRVGGPWPTGRSRRAALRGFARGG
jgi:hypothetical protein